jgi:hypothetical protein
VDVAAQSFQPVQAAVLFDLGGQGLSLQLREFPEVGIAVVSLQTRLDEFALFRRELQDCVCLCQWKEFIAR